MSALNENAVTVLSRTTGVDLNSAVATELMRVPYGFKAIINSVVIYGADTSLTTASYSFGYNDPDYDNVIANATHTELVDATVLVRLPAKAGAKIGVSGDQFKIIANTVQGAAATVSIDVLGYLIKN